MPPLASKEFEYESQDKESQCCYGEVITEQSSLFAVQHNKEWKTIATGGGLERVQQNLVEFESYKNDGKEHMKGELIISNSFC